MKKTIVFAISLLAVVSHANPTPDEEDLAGAERGVISYLTDLMPILADERRWGTGMPSAAMATPDGTISVRLLGDLASMLDIGDVRVSVSTLTSMVESFWRPAAQVHKLRLARMPVSTPKSLYTKMARWCAAMAKSGSEPRRWYFTAWSRVFSAGARVMAAAEIGQVFAADVASAAGRYLDALSPAELIELYLLP